MPGWGRGSFDDEEMIASTMQSMMTIYEYIMQDRNLHIEKQDNVEKALSMIGIPYDKNNKIDYPDLSISPVEKKNYIEFKLVYRVITETMSGLQTKKKSPEYYKWVILTNQMIHVETVIEPSPYVDEKLKADCREKMIEKFKRVYRDLKEDYIEMMRDVIFAFYQRLLVLSGKAAKPYGEIMAKHTSPKQISAFYDGAEVEKDDELIDEEDEDDY